MYNDWYPRRTILLLPRTKTVTALELAHSSMTNIFSLVVPNVISLTIPARPSLSADKSSNRGTIRPLVAMAMSCDEFRHNREDVNKLPRSPVRQPIARQEARFA
jgi:hypothetical protein